MLVNCVAYQDGRTLGQIEPREIRDYTNRPGCVVWMAMLKGGCARSSTPHELDWRLGYPLAIGIMVGIDGYLFYRFKKAKWL